MCMTKQTEARTARRDYKSKMFTMIFKDKREFGDYAEYVRRVREYVKDMSIEQAVDKTISECVQEGILQEFLKNNRAEARAMSIYEYDQEEHIRLEREDAYEDGRRDGVVEGKAEGRLEGRAEGERKKLIELVEKKLAKEQTIEQIAEALEESVDVIREICRKVKDSK